MEPALSTHRNGEPRRMESPSESQFPVRFSGRLRPSQKDIVEIARAKLKEGRRRIHIVAPPGSGKTVLGLYLWAE